MSESGAIKLSIIGGGIGGLTLCVALSSLAPEGKYEIHLFEAAQKFEEIGAGVGFGPNSVKTLDKLNLRGVYGLDLKPEGLKEEEEKPHHIWFNWRRGDGNFGENEGTIGRTIAPGYQKASVHRADFLSLLLSRLPPTCTVHFSSRLTSYTSPSDSSVTTLHFEDGHTFETDLLIGCDGVRSVVRAGLFGDEYKARFTGTCAFRGLIEVEKARQALGDWATKPVMWLGVDKHVLHFPVRRQTLVNIVAFTSDRSTSTPEWKSGPWVQTVSKDEFLGEFEGWDERVQRLLQFIENPSRWAIHDVPPIPSFAMGKVALLGDSAHAMLPHQGAGAGQAIEDAYLLANILAHELTKRETLGKALAVYSEIRLPRAQKVHWTSEKAGRVYEMVEPGIERDTEKMRAELETRMSWIWEWEPEEERSKAFELLLSSTVS
ncbi:FAD/NAD(P)-binding domain-containing protein [Atractiella rhizophila]|nr:FAD/NAD(P)-binding domain-containing protein [Atractiella rhizophila]